MGPIAFAFVLTTLAACSLRATEGVREVSIRPEVRVRVRTFAQTSSPVPNPIRWVQFSDRVPEGTRVAEGDPIFEPNLEPRRENLEARRNRLDVVLNESERRRMELDRSVRDLENRRDNLADEKAVEEARLAYLDSLPVPENVAIARGRLEVAESRLVAEEENLATMRERLEKGLISEAMVQDAAHQRDLQRARTDYARNRLRAARLPAHEKEREVVQLRIRNLELELKKTTFEIAAQEKLNDIERRSLERKVEEVRRDIRDREEELTHEFIRAPRDGVLLYTSQLKQELAKGGQPSKGMNLAEIPHEDSLAFEGELPERVRHLFREGDPAEIRLNRDPDRVLRGRLASISPFSRDADEENETGVKVLDLVIELDDPPPDVAFGIYGWAVIRAAEPRTAPAVPVSWIRYREGKPHASVDGVYQPVDGLVHENLFQFKEPYPDLERLQSDGVWPLNDQERFEVESDRFHASGELIPVTSEGVTVPSVRAWDIKVADLHPENTVIEQGDIVAELDSERIRDRAEEGQQRLAEAKEEKNTAEKELELRERERDFQVESAQNLLRIRRRERDLELLSLSSSEIDQARLDVETAELNLRRAKRELKRLRARADMSAPAEIARRERDVQRRELQLERARIQQKQIQEGLDEVEKSRAELEVIRQEAETAKTRADHFRKVARAQSRLRWRTRRLRQREERGERATRDLASLEIPAPVSGLVKYERVWDGVRRSKIKTGSRVWRGMQILSLSNTGEMVVDVRVPERYVRNVKEGMSVQIRIPAEGGRSWNGEVLRLGQLLEPAENDEQSSSPYTDREPTRQQVLPVRVRVHSRPEIDLKPGAVAHVIFPFNA